MPTYGAIAELTATCDFDAYYARVEAFFRANEVDAGTQVDVLLSSIGTEAYERLYNHFRPDDPANKTLSQLKTALKTYYDRQPSALHERFVFRRIRQEAGESVRDFAARIEKGARFCKYKAGLLTDRHEEAVRDQFVFGLREADLRSELLREETKAFADALLFANSWETSHKESSEIQMQMQPNQVSVSKVKAIPTRQSRRTEEAAKKTYTCQGCGRSDHKRNECPFRQATCHRCRKKGHIQAVCRSNTQPNKETTARPGRANHLQLHHINAITRSNADTIFVTPLLNGTPVKMELDTGSSVTLVPQDLILPLLPELSLTSANDRLFAFTGQRIDILGKTVVTVTFNSTTKELPIYVSKAGDSALFGRSWINTFLGEDWFQKCSSSHESSVKMINSDLPDLLARHAALFEETLGHYSEKVHITTYPDAIPKFCKARRLPYALKEKVEEEINRLVNLGILEPVRHADWATPVHPVVKRDGSIRLCGDFKVTVNQASPTEQYPIPRIEDLFATLGQGSHYSTLDLKMAYNQLELDDSSASLTTVNTHIGLFRHRRLPFGISSAPAIFQRTIEQVLRGLPGVQVFLDDIIVTGSTPAEHLQNLEQVFDRLAKAGFRLNLEKCRFMENSVQYLGHRIDNEGLHPLKERIEAVTKAPAPKDKAQLESFIGLLTYYARFLPNMSTALEPLYQLKRKDVPWRWTRRENNAFKQAKQLLTNSEVLMHFNPELPIVLSCDASSYGVGAVLSHTVDGINKPIAFASKTMNKAQRGYSQLEREALSIVFGLKRFQQYLLGHHFELLTDHKPLLGLIGSNRSIPENASSRLQRWAIYMAGFSYTLNYRCNQQHLDCDALSRVPLEEELEESEDKLVHSLFLEEPQSLTAKDIRRATAKDPVLRQVQVYVQSGWPHHVEPIYSDFLRCRNELSCSQGCLLRGIQVVVPTTLRKKVLKELHATHQGMVNTKAIARSYVWWPRITNEIEEMVRECLQCRQLQAMPSAATPAGWEFPQQPWSRVHVDYAGPLNGYWYLVCVDAYSKWPEVERTKTITAEKTIEILRRIFANKGLPKTLVSDNGTCFTSHTFQAWLKGLHIHHCRSPPFFPATNGQAERFVRTLKSALRAITGDAEQALAQFLLRYRVTPHSVTGESPSMLMFKRQIRTRLDALRPEVADRVSELRPNAEAAPERLLREGDQVLARSYNGRRWASGTITRARGARTFDVSLPDGRTWSRHLDQLRKTAEPQPTSTPDRPPSPEPTPESTAERTSSPPSSTESSPAVAVPLRRSQRTRKPPDRLNYS